MCSTNSLDIKGSLRILEIILLAIIVILLFSYFHITLHSVVESPTGPVQNLKSVVQSPETQTNVNYVTDQSLSVWNTYLKVPLTNFWNNIFIPYIWNPFMQNMQLIHDGKYTNIQQLAPQVNMSNH